jgi:hypothetical protein
MSFRRKVEISSAGRLQFGMPHRQTSDRAIVRRKPNATATLRSLPRRHQGFGWVTPWISPGTGAATAAMTANGSAHNLQASANRERCIHVTVKSGESSRTIRWSPMRRESLRLEHDHNDRHWKARRNTNLGSEYCRERDRPRHADGERSGSFILGAHAPGCGAVECADCGAAHSRSSRMLPSHR